MPCHRLIVTADPAGLATLAGHYAPMDEKMSAHLADRTVAELATILAFMRAGHQAADEEIARIREQDIHHATRRRRTTSAAPGRYIHKTP